MLRSYGPILVLLVSDRVVKSSTQDGLLHTVAVTFIGRSWEPGAPVLRFRDCSIWQSLSNVTVVIKSAPYCLW